MSDVTSGVLKGKGLLTSIFNTLFTPVCNNNMYSLVVLRYMNSCILVFSAVLFVLCIPCIYVLITINIRYKNANL